MAFVTADLTAVETAIKSGELRVQYQDRLVQYRSIAELLQARDFITRQIAAPSAVTGRKAKQVRLATKRGFGE